MKPHEDRALVAAQPLDPAITHLLPGGRRSIIVGKLSISPRGPGQLRHRQGAESAVGVQRNSAVVCVSPGGVGGGAAPGEDTPHSEVTIIGCHAGHLSCQSVGDREQCVPLMQASCSCGKSAYCAAPAAAAFISRLRAITRCPKRMPADPQRKTGSRSGYPAAWLRLVTRPDPGRGLMTATRNDATSKVKMIGWRRRGKPEGMASRPFRHSRRV